MIKWQIHWPVVTGKVIFSVFRVSSLEKSRHQDIKMGTFTVQWCISNEKTVEFVLQNVFWNCLVDLYGSCNLSVHDKFHGYSVGKWKEGPWHSRLAFYSALSKAENSKTLINPSHTSNQKNTLTSISDLHKISKVTQHEQCEKNNIRLFHIITTLGLSLTWFYIHV